LYIKGGGLHEIPGWSVREGYPGRGGAGVMEITILKCQNSNGTISKIILHRWTYLDQTMEKIQKIISGLLFFGIIILSLMVLFPPVDNREKTITPVPVSNKAIVPPPVTKSPLTIADEENASSSLNGEWVKMNSNAKWPERLWHCSAAMWDGSIVLIGGQATPLGITNDVWSSPDHGITWKQMTSSAPWSERIGHSCVALPDESIVLMGGSIKNDVWRSTDSGITWVEMTANAGWAPRKDQSSMVMPDGSILVLGGDIDDQGHRVNDVWRSTDKGATWTQVTEHAGWAPRRYQSAVALSDGSVVVMGGNGFNDVWRSADYGVAWTQKTAHAGWTPRFGQTVVALQGGSILLMGGRDPAMKNDTWISHDEGATWALVNQSSGWEARDFATSVVTHDGSVVLIGGEGEKGMKNDVWVFLRSGQPVPTKQPTPAPTTILPTPRITTVPTASEVRDTDNPSLFIRMDPIQDFETDSAFNITGPTTLNMTIKTNYPEESLFSFDIINEDSSRHLLTRVDIQPAVMGMDGLNATSYIYNMKGQPIGHYRAEVNKANTNTTVTGRFNINPPGLWVWVWTDPIGTVYEGDMVTITGTTNMEPGGEIAIDMNMMLHPCPYFDKSEVNQSQRWLCYHNCNYSPGPETATVIQSLQGKNIWRATINTTGWCWNEEYYFRTRVSDWINVTGGSSFRVNQPKQS
jgi:hypothetical protein